MENQAIDQATGEVSGFAAPGWSPVIVGLTPEAELAGRKAFATALARCYTDVASVKKDGYNSFYKYHYPTADAIYNAAKAAMAKNGLAIVPMMDRITEEEVVNNQGKKETFTRVGYRFAIIEASTGYTVEVPWVADAIDNLDKGINKSLTGALKSFLRIFFAISDGDDPDAKEPEKGAEPVERVAGGKKSAAKSEAPAPQTAPAKEKTPEEQKAQAILLEALPSLRSQDEREQGEAKYVVDRLKGAAEAAGYKLSEAILLLAGETGKLTRARLVEVEALFDTIAELRKLEGADSLSARELFQAAADGVVTEADLALWQDERK